MKDSLPEAYLDNSTYLLEQLVTRYQEILNHVAQTANPENNTFYYHERIHVLETEQKDAKFGPTEKQRIAGFLNARERAIEGITALLFYLNRQ